MEKLMTYRHDPLAGLLNEFFGKKPFTNGISSPLVNVKESDTEFSLEILAPGYNKKDFDIQVENGIITISSKFEDKSSEVNENYTIREFYQSSFSRSFRLPKNANSDEIEAKYSNSILTLGIPKSEPVKKSKQIDIK